MSQHHRMVEDIVEPSYHAQRLYSCPHCSRRVVLDHGRLTVLDRGDMNATHSGGTTTATVTIKEQTS